MIQAAKFHVLHETWDGDTRSLDVLIYHEYYSPADLKLCFSADGSVVMYARGYSDEGVFYRMPADFLLTFVKTSSLWLKRLDEARKAELEAQQEVQP